MDRIPSVIILQNDGGTLIKQGDSETEFAYSFKDEKNEPIVFETQSAKVSLLNKTTRVIEFEQNFEVTGSTLTFTIDKILPSGEYDVEVEVGGYVAPSEFGTATLEIEENHFNKSVGKKLEHSFLIENIAVIGDTPPSNIPIWFDTTE